MEIKVGKPTPEKLKALKVESWPIWEKEASTFSWYYDDQESCYILEGQVIVTPDGGDPVTIEKGDFVVFSKGLRCTWNIVKDIKKHYNFG